MRSIHIHPSIQNSSFYCISHIFRPNSVDEMSNIGSGCSICSLPKAREGGDDGFTPVDVLPGASMKVLRESPTTAFVRFTAGSVEPSHHHTFGHDVVVLKGKMSAWNLSTGERNELGVGDYLFTAAGDLHRVKYHEDTEFFIKWDGAWDLIFDEDVVAANAVIDSETSVMI